MRRNGTLLGNVWEYENPASFHPIFAFEEMDYGKWKHFMAENWLLPFYVSGVYLVVIFTIEHFMKTRKPFKLTYSLIFWNWGLGIFSMLGFIRVGPELLKVLRSPDGFYKSVCVREGLNRPAATWALLFAFSKYVELGDTFFITMRKRPLAFLQWYHHVTALVLAWQVVPFAEAIQRYYGFLNYAVHSIMYPYFALRAMKFRIPNSFAMMITILQLLQMIAGVALNLFSVYFMYIGKACAREPQSIKWIAAIYGSFIILFGDFFYKRYVVKRKTH